MATLNSIAQLLISAVIAQTSVTAFITNPLRRTEKLTAGQTLGASMPVAAGSVSDSNTNYPVGEYSIAVLHRLADPSDEETYREGAMATDQAVLMAPSFWRVTGIKEVVEVPEMDRPERIGNIIEYTVSVQLAIVP